MQMTNTQLFLAIGIPTLAVLIGFLSTMVQISTINVRIGDLVARLSALEQKVDQKFDFLMQKFYELDNHLLRIEDRLNLRP
jgi:hypothetical protein